MIVQLKQSTKDHGLHSWLECDRGRKKIFGRKYKSMQFEFLIYRNLLGFQIHSFWIEQWQIPHLKEMDASDCAVGLCCNQDSSVFIGALDVQQQQLSCSGDTGI